MKRGVNRITQRWRVTWADLDAALGEEIPEVPIGGHRGAAQSWT
jgi:hypothetical protein